MPAASLGVGFGIGNVERVRTLVRAFQEWRACRIGLHREDRQWRGPTECAAIGAMNFKHIELLARTATLGSISAAAEEMGMSSSLASRNIASLEKELGTHLLQRTTRSLQVTEAGALAVKWARSSVEGYAAMVDEMRALQGKPAGLVRIACTEFLALSIVADVLVDFAARYPEIKVSVLATDKVVQLNEGQFDVAIHVGPAPDSNLAVREIRAVNTRLCASPRYLEAHGTPVHPADLLQHRCLAHATYEQRNWFFKKDGEIVSQPIEPVVLTTNTSMLRELAVKGTGIARISRRMLKDDLDAGRLVLVLPDYEPTLPNGRQASVWALFPDCHLLHRTRLVVDAIVERMRQDD